MRTKLTQLRSRLGSGMVVATALCAVSGCGMADWRQKKHEIAVGYHRNNAWPDPFTEVDAQEVIAPFEIMKRNGWRLHNTIGHELFREGDGVLLASGNKRVHWIATQAPPTRRQIFVLRGKTPTETDARVASVRQTLASMHLQDAPPTVMVTDIEPGTSSGAWATKVNREWLSSLPKPQLPKTTISGEASAAEASGD